MIVQDQINQYLASLSETKAEEMKMLQGLILAVLPKAELWFDEGKNAAQKTVCNPTIGFGNQLLQYANGTTKPFFQIGLSPNQAGISIYIIGLKDKHFLTQTFAETIGKAKLSGYCIKFSTLQHIQLNVLESALRQSIALVAHANKPKPAC